MSLIKQFKVGDLNVKIMQDEDPDSPRSDDGNARMVCFHRRYELGDKHSYASPQELYASDEFKNAAVVLPLYLYDHGILRIKVGSFDGLLPQGHAQFDTMQVGYIFWTREQVKENYGWNRITAKRKAKLTEYLEAEVTVYDDYLSGSVYGFIVETDSEEHVDSCWGFYGFEDVQAEGKASAESWNTEHAKAEKLVMA